MISHRHGALNLTFYQGKAFPDWNGDALIGSLKAGTLYRVRVENNAPSEVERLLVNFGAYAMSLSARKGIFMSRLSIMKMAPYGALCQDDDFNTSVDKLALFTVTFCHVHKFFSAEHSIFSAKARAYLRFKHDQNDLGLGFEDILATPDLMRDLLTVRSGQPVFASNEAPDGTWIQDTSEIIDYVEKQHRSVPVIPDCETRPKQRLASYILSLGDEWLLVPACWERWHYSLETTEPNHRAFNEQQWGSFLAPDKNGKARRVAGAAFFENIFGISDTRDNPKAPIRAHSSRLHRCDLTSLVEYATAFAASA